MRRLPQHRPDARLLRAAVRIQYHIEPLERRMLLAAGDLDLTFGMGGKVTTNFSGEDRAYAITTQADGRILVAGTSGGNFAVARYTSAGVLDNTFGIGGRVTTDFGGTHDAAYAIAVQSDAKILVGGVTGAQFGGSFALARYDTSGALDPTFDIDGKVTTAIPGGDSARINALAIQSNGRIIAAGENADFTIVRYLSTGALDTSFDGDGIAITAFPGNFSSLATGVAIQSDGKIVAGGSVFKSTLDYDFALVRYTTAGALDQTFDGDGRVITPAGTINGIGGGDDEAYSLAIQPDGRMVLGGTSRHHFVVARYNTSGSLDSTFDNDGVASKVVGQTTGSAAFAMSIGAGGRIIIGGRGHFSTSHYNFALTRFHTDGGLDRSFGTQGVVHTDFAGSDDEIRALKIQSDGKFLAAGSAGSFNADFALARYDGVAAPNVAPVAEANGPYTMRENGRIFFDSRNSSDSDGILVAHEWDFDYDGTFTVDSTDPFPIFNANGIDGPSMRTVALRVTDDRGATGFDTAPLTVQNTPPQLSINGPAAVLAGVPYTLSLSAVDPAPDTIVSWQIDWGDGQVQPIAGNPSSVAHTYVTTGNYTIRALATDEDGTYEANLGVIDASFGGPRVFDLLPGGPDVASRALLLQDGSVLICGNLNFAADLTLVRFTPSGDLDPSFGNSGVVLLNFGIAGSPATPTEEEGTAVAVTPDGKILVAANRYYNNDSDFAIARFTTAGVLDMAFGDAGRVFTNFGANATDDRSTSIIVFADGSFVVGGTSAGNFALARYSSTGAPDLNFDGDGKLTTDLGGNNDRIEALALQPNGMLVAAGAGPAGFALARYHSPTGALDLSFGLAGKVLTPLAGYTSHFFRGVAIAPGGNIVAAGSANSNQTLRDFVVARYDHNGALDPSFSGDGIFVHDTSSPDVIEVDELRGVSVAPDGSILAGGFSHLLGPGRFTLVKLTSTGVPDPSFGDAGFLFSEFVTGVNPTHLVFGMSTYGDKTVLAGWSTAGGGNSNTTVVRYNVAPQKVSVVPANPSVTASDFLLDEPRMTLRFSFDSNVQASLAPADLILFNQTTGSFINPVTFALSYDASTNRASFTFPGFSNGVLPDGEYRATLHANSVTDPLGNPLTMDHVFDFFFLQADANHDGRVNLRDFNILASNFGQSPRTFSQADFNFDSFVNLRDFNILATQFGKSLLSSPLSWTFLPGTREISDEPIFPPRASSRKVLDELNQPPPLDV